MPLAIPNHSIKFVSAFKDLHHFSESGEGKFHWLITYVFRKIDSNEDRFLPISERPTPFVETQRDICFTKTAFFFLCEHKGPPSSKNAVGISFCTNSIIYNICNIGINYKVFM